MNKKIYNRELLFTSRLNINIFIFFILALFCLTLIISTKKEQLDTNVFDLLLKITDFLPISHMIIPLFLIVMTAHFHTGEVNNYLIFRFTNKRHWYRTNVVRIAQLATVFCFAILAIMLMQSLFILSFKNNWSEFSLEYYEYFTVFLTNYSPLSYTTATVMILWLFLFLLGLIFYILLLWTKNSILSFLFVYLLNLINIAVTLGKVDSLSPFFFTSHLSIMQYIYKSGLSQENFPYSIFLYWFILIIIAFLIGWLIVGKVDLNFKDGDTDDAS